MLKHLRAYLSVRRTLLLIARRPDVAFLLRDGRPPPKSTGLLLILLPRKQRHAPGTYLDQVTIVREVKYEKKTYFYSNVSYVYVNYSRQRMLCVSTAFDSNAQYGLCLFYGNL